MTEPRKKIKTEHADAAFQVAGGLPEDVQDVVLSRVGVGCKPGSTKEVADACGISSLRCNELYSEGLDLIAAAVGSEEVSPEDVPRLLIVGHMRTKKASPLLAGGSPLGFLLDMMDTARAASLTPVTRLNPDGSLIPDVASRDAVDRMIWGNGPAEDSIPTPEPEAVAGPAMDEVEPESAPPEAEFFDAPTPAPDIDEKPAKG